MPRRLSTESLARASARHPGRTIAAWVLVLAAAAFAVASFLGDALTSDDEFTSRPESVRAEALIAQDFGPGETGFDADEAVVVRSSGGTVDDPAVRERVERLERELGALGELEGIRTYLDGDASLVSPDRSTTVLLLDLRDDGDVEPVVDLVQREDGRDGFEVLVTGEESVDAAIEETAGQDLLRGETVGIAVALAILLVVVGGLVAALVPIVVAIASIVGALGLTALVGQAFTLQFFVVNMLVMMGLAVGIDYSLLVLSRFREERAQAGGRSRPSRGRAPPPAARWW